jgi:hypothetical protein
MKEGHLHRKFLNKNFVCKEIIMKKLLAIFMLLFATGALLTPVAFAADGCGCDKCDCSGSCGDACECEDCECGK